MDPTLNVTRWIWSSVAGVCLGLSFPAGAEPAGAPEFAFLRFQDDVGYFADPRRRRAVRDAVKYVPLGDDPANYLSFGGEWRERYDHVSAVGFGLTGQTKNDVLLHRFLLHGDLHIGDALRGFVQFGSHFQSGRDGGAGPFDDDALDVQQGFAELTIGPDDAVDATMRAGRQEIALGSARLVGVRESPNIRRSFDAVRAIFRVPAWRLDALAGSPVTPEDGVFDDGRDDEQRLWGLYAVGRNLLAAGSGLDLYYLGLERENVRFSDVAGDEKRHSLGARLWGARSGWDYNLELVYQFGDFADADIRAWTVASDTGYRFDALPLRPRLGIKANIASGDDDPSDGDIGTFNPLFPNNAYFSEAAVFTPANFFDLHPEATFEISPTLTALLGWNVIWRQSTDDAIYAPGLVPLIDGDVSDDRFVGDQVIVELRWRPTRHVDVRGGYVRFNRGDFITAAGGTSIDYAFASVAFRF